jgi:hypothetical protein
MRLDKAASDLQAALVDEAGLAAVAAQIRAIAEALVRPHAWSEPPPTTADNPRG